MSNGSPKAVLEGGVAELEKKVAGLTNGISELEHLMSRERKLRWLTVVLILAVVIILVFLTGRAVVNIDQEALLSLAEQRTPRVVKTLTDEVAKVYEKSAPEVQSLLAKKLEERLPSLQAKFEKELETLVINLNAGVNQQIERELKALEREVRAIVAREFPDLTEEQMHTILLNLHKAMVAVCADFISRHMEDHVALLVDIDKIIMGFEDDKPIPGDAEVVAELKQISLQLLETKLTKILDTDTSAK